MNFQYLRNKITKKIKSCGFTDLSSQVNDDYELIFGELPKDAIFEKFEDTKEGKKAEILKQLEELDKKSIRSLREGNTERINKLETEAKALRTELQSL